MGLTDASSASFTVPIDVYGMNVRDINIVEAAHAVQFDMCFYQQDSLTADEIASAQAWLAEGVAFAPSRWFFGAWDAPFIAQNGWPGLPTNMPSLWPDGLSDVQIAAAQDCVNNNATVAEFTPSSPMYGFNNTAQLESYWSEGFEYAQQDQRFIDLTSQRNACIVSKGYAVSVQPGVTVPQLDISRLSSDEQILAANISVAQCADDMNYTQQVVDIVAAYQMVTISQHEAELTAIKQSLDDLVAKATGLLKQYGVM